METAGYTALTRQTGLLREMQTVANNVANLSTTGFRKEGVVFAEHVQRLGRDDASVSMALAQGRQVDLSQGPLRNTGGTFDIAIEGNGFFLIETPDGTALTRAGHFMPNADGELVTPDGRRLLDAGGAPIFVPPDAEVAISADGTVSAAGRPLAQIGLFGPPNGTQDLIHQGGTLFATTGAPEPVDGGILHQGFLENSNVNPVSEIARMIEVQRAYELGQGFLDREDQRIRALLQSVRN